MLSQMSSTKLEIDMPFREAFLCGRMFSMQCVTIKTDMIIIDKLAFFVNAAVLDSNFVGFHINIPSPDLLVYMDSFKKSSFNEILTINQQLYSLSNFIFFRKMRPTANSNSDIYITSNFPTLEIPCSHYMSLFIKYFDLQEEVDMGELSKSNKFI
eukprot:NODE_736_length_4706_cov_0.180161.p3 type:complete len:155 gc:universal NODE_736_length_4706_cov_0.180161:3280-2816(-)